MDGKGRTAAGQTRASESDAQPPLTVGPSALVRLRGAQPIAPQALLQVADGVVRALSRVGITEVRIEVEVDGGDSL